MIRYMNCGTRILPTIDPENPYELNEFRETADEDTGSIIFEK
jgi:hypothetical protein